MKKFIASIGILIWKDVIIDLRRKENFLSMFFFSVLTLLIFYFAMGDRPHAFQIAAPGIIWVAFLMAGILGLNKSFAQEIENGCLGGILLTPVDRGSLFIGKMLGTTLFLTLLQLLLIPLCILFFGIMPQHWGSLIAVLVAGTLGFTSLGTLLASMTATLKGKEVLLPILLFPLMIPSLISVAKITTFVFFDGNPQDVLIWWKLVLGFDVIFMVVSYLGFEFVTEE
ncbi:heme exporter protein CcmB [Deltaproteobacteria bacterium TL4]